MGLRWIGTVFILCEVMYTAFGCSCFMRNLQEELCSSDFAFRGVIEGKEMPRSVDEDGNPVIVFGGEVKYTVRVLENFKNQNNIVAGSEAVVDLFSHTQDSMCGMPYLEVGDDYFFIGSSSSLSYCSRTTAWSEFVEEHLRGAMALGWELCDDCQITWDQEKGRDYCRFNHRGGPPEQFDGVCLRNNGGVCKWTSMD